MFGVFCHSCGFLDSCSWPSRCETETFERTTRKIDFILESFDGHPSSIAIVLRFDDLQELVAKHAAPDVMGQCQKRSSKPFFPWNRSVKNQDTIGKRGWAAPTPMQTYVHVVSISSRTSRQRFKIQGQTWQKNKIANWWIWWEKRCDIFWFWTGHFFVCLCCRRALLPPVGFTFRCFCVGCLGLHSVVTTACCARSRRQAICTRCLWRSPHKIFVRDVKGKFLLKLSRHDFEEGLCSFTRPLHRIPRRGLLARSEYKMSIGALSAQIPWRNLDARLLDKMSLRDLLARSLYEISVQTSYKRLFWQNLCKKHSQDDWNNSLCSGSLYQVSRRGVLANSLPKKIWKIPRKVP